MKYYLVFCSAVRRFTYLSTLNCSLAINRTPLGSLSLATERKVEGRVPGEARLEVGLTRESLFEILARSETCFLDPKFSRDSRQTRELVARLASREFHRQKLRSETREKRVLLRNFVARIASYESHRKKFRSKTRFSLVSQTNFIVRLASLANRNFIARLVRIITNFNSGVLRESCENIGSNTNFSL